MISPHQALLSDPAALTALFTRLKATLDHPVCPLPTAAQVVALLQKPQGQEELAKIIDDREEIIRLMVTDPLRCGYEIPWWKDARELLKTHDELWILGGNDSAKSWLLAKLGVEMLVDEPDIEYVFGHNTEASSINQQQKVVYKFLPPEWRDLGKKGRHIDVTYNSHGGFKENKFVLPNLSRGYFFFWKQQPGDLAGYKSRGVSGDELITMGHVEELRARGLGKGGKLVIGFTPIYGYTPPVADCLSGAKIIQTRPSLHLPGKNFDHRPEVPPGHMPYILQGRRSTVAILCAFTEWNPFRKGGPEALEKLIEGKSKSYISIRAYGWADKTIGAAFPKFNPAVNIIARSKEHLWNGGGMVPPFPWAGHVVQALACPERLPGSVVEDRSGDRLKPALHTALYPTLPKDGTNYVIADPGGDKNWFIKWYRCGAKPAWTFVYREWPPMSTHGPWAEPTSSEFRNETHIRWDGYKGPAQRFDYDPSIIRYKRLVLEAEGWVWDESAGEWDGTAAEPIHERYIDPAMGGTPVPSAEEGTSIIGLMADEQRDQKGRLIGPSMEWLPAKRGAGAIHNRVSLEKFNCRLHYNTEEPLTVLNCPSWYIVDACEQSTYAMTEYTGQDGEKGALKDVIDPDWYFDATDLEHVAPGQMGSHGGGSY